MTVRPLSPPFRVPCRQKAGFMRRLVLVAAAVGGAYDRWLQRQALADLDDRLLDDIGLTRRDVTRECAKGFWSRRA